MTEQKIGATAPGTDEAEGEPDWFAEAWNLSEQGVSATDVAKAVGKRADTVRKLIKRKKDAIAAAADAAPAPVDDTAKLPEPEVEPVTEPKADEPAKGAQPTGTVTAEQAARLQALAGNSAGDDEPQAELFPAGSIEGDGFTHKSIGTAKEPVTEITVAMTGGEVPMPHGSGLLDPHREGMLLVTYECTDGGRPIPIREGDRGEKKIVGWKTRQQVRPVYIERVKGEEGVIEGHFAALLEAEPSRAGALLDRLIVRAGRSLQ